MKLKALPRSYYTPVVVTHTLQHRTLSHAAVADARDTHTHCRCCLADIEPGWSMTFDPDNLGTFKAELCGANRYGVPERIYGLQSAPCKACAKNLLSAQGSSSFQACYNPAGFGYSSEGANQCPDGFYAAEASMQPCEQCPPGRYTDYMPGFGIDQSSIYDCKIPAGFGVFSADEANPFDPAVPTATMSAQKCPVGFYSPGDPELAGSQTNNPKCKRCPPGTSTSVVGSAVCNGEWLPKSGHLDGLDLVPPHYV